MYLVDLSSGSGGRASVLRPVSAQNPRALDWRAIK